MDSSQAFQRVNRALATLPPDQQTEEMRWLQQCERELGTAAALAREAAAAAGQLSLEAFKVMAPPWGSKLQKPSDRRTSYVHCGSCAP